MRNIIFLLVISIFYIGCSDGQVDDPPTVTTNSDEKNKTVLSDDENKTVSSDDENISNIPDNTIIDGGSYNNEKKEIYMVREVIYRVEKGDYIQEIDNAKVKIMKNSENSFSEIILLSGKAKLVRGDGN